MKTPKLYLLPLLLLPVLSCQREGLSPENGKSDKIEIVALSEPLVQTKADIDSDSGLLTWTEGDQIAIWFAAPPLSQYYDAIYTTTDAVGRGIFISQNNGTRSNYAVYPASYAVLSQHGEPNLYVNLPSNYEINNSSVVWKSYYTTFSPLPMVAVNSTGNILEFKHVGGVLRVTLTGVPAGAKKIVFHTGRKLTGDFCVDTTDPDAPFISTDNPTASGSGETVTFTLLNALTSTETFTINLPLPVGVHETLSAAVYNDSDEPLGFANDADTYGVFRAEGRKVTLKVHPGPDGLATFSVSDASLMLEETQTLVFEANYLSGTTLTPTTDVYLSATSSDRDICSVVVDNSVTPPTITVTGHKEGVASIAVTAQRDDYTIRNRALVTVSGLYGINLEADDMVCVGHTIPVTAVVLLYSGIEVPVSMAQEFTYDWEVVSGASPSVFGVNARTTSFTAPASAATVVVRCTATYKGMSITSDPFSIDVFKNPAGSVPGVFSVSAGGSAGKKVFFSTGGLLLRNGLAINDAGSTLTISTNQLYRRSGYTSVAKPFQDAEERDLFDREEAREFHDGTTPIWIGGVETLGWRHLWMYDYWTYLLFDRDCFQVGSTPNARFVFCIVDSVPGLMIFPDHYNHPADVKVPNFINQENARDAAARTRYNLYEWAKLEAAGVAFLPYHKYFWSTYYADTFYYWLGNGDDYGYIYNMGSLFGHNIETNDNYFYPIRLIKEK